MKYFNEYDYERLVDVFNTIRSGDLSSFLKINSIICRNTCVFFESIKDYVDNTEELDIEKLILEISISNEEYKYIQTTMLIRDRNSENLLKISFLIDTTADPHVIYVEDIGF